MKKLLLSMAVVASAMFVACTSSEKKAEENESAIASKIENCTNPDSMKVYVQQANEYVQKLVNEGKLDEAKAYLDKIEPVVNEKAPALAGTFATVKAAVETVSDATKNAADSVANAATDAAAEKVQEAKDAANDAVEAGKNAAADAANKAADKVSDAADKAKDKIANALK